MRTKFNLRLTNCELISWSLSMFRWSCVSTLAYPRLLEFYEPSGDRTEPLELLGVPYPLLRTFGDEFYPSAGDAPLLVFFGLFASTISNNIILLKFAVGFDLLKTCLISEILSCHLISS